ncbi:uncharacterized protein [Chelonus insularis]|uniref:uncharacterized protein n=1 Tax=Chelonus insularis TaxID=460826 RepID=UPI00158AC11B|nr:uncharacterized protein LOC118065773 [Chelonus insularis]
MNFAQAEKFLAVLYLVSALLSVISVICIVTVWQYWTRTLNLCIDVDCGCILYSVNTFSKFMGGDVKICHFVSLAAIPAIVFGLMFGLYHGYRSLINKKLSDPRIVACQPVCYNRENNSEHVVVITPKRRTSCKSWMPTTFLAALITCLSLAHTVVITDGYYKTCEQYKKNLIHLLGSSGREAEAIYNRLNCGAIFDYMDYIEPDANNWRRGDEINTGLALQCAITTVWFNCFSWVAIFVINFTMNRKKKNQNSEKTYCFGN